MDIHRCRFVPFPSSPINAIAFTNTSLLEGQSLSDVRLAVGRANGDIELWNPLGGKWHQETIIRGAKDRSIEGLVWFSELDQVTADGSIFRGRSRLFSIGYTSTVTEWDLEKRKPKRHAVGEHGEIWCMALQPSGVDGDVKPNVMATASQTRGPQRLVVGTVTGSLALYSIDDDELRFQRVIVKSAGKTAKPLSITFQNRHVAIVGCSDSCIRAYDIRNGQLLRKMTLGSDLVGGSKEIIVWSVKCLPDGDIVSADSTGQVCIWEGKTYTQSQRLQSHKQDVLSLAISVDGSTIVSGGMDKRTVFYKKTSGSGPRWARTSHRRYHHHDVKAMASFEGSGMSVVVSGGPDAHPVVLSLKQAASEHHRTLPSLPQVMPIHGAPLARLLVSWWEREVHIWRLLKAPRELLLSPVPEPNLERNRLLLAKVMIKGDFNITSASISCDGSLLVVSTCADVKAFWLKLSADSARMESMEISKVDIPASISDLGATIVQISPDGSWICMVKEGQKAFLARISRKQTDDSSSVLVEARAVKLRRLNRNLKKNVSLGALGNYERSITQVTFSADSKVLAVADIAGYIDTWVLRGAGPTSIRTVDDALPEDYSSSSPSGDSSDTDHEEEISKPAWTRNSNAALIPKLPAAPVVLSFSKDNPPNTSVNGPTANMDNDYTLAAITTAWHIMTFHPLLGRLTRWARRNPLVKLPEQLKSTRDLAKGVLWHGSRIWIYGVSFLFMLDMSQDSWGPAPSPLTNDDQEKSQGLPGEQQIVLGQGVKRKRALHDSGAGNRMEDREALEPRLVKAITNRGGWKLIKDDDQVRDQMKDDTDDDDDEAYSEAHRHELQRPPVPETQPVRSELALALQENPGSVVSHIASGGDGRRRWWQTFKYRPVVGIVELGGVGKTGGLDGKENGDEDEDAEMVVTSASKYATEELPPLEVALVERPIWDVELPPRVFEEDEGGR